MTARDPDEGVFFYRTDPTRAEAILLRGFAAGGGPWSAGPRVTLTDNPAAVPGNAVLRVTVTPDVARQVLSSERPRRRDGVRCFVVTPDVLETAKISLVDQAE